MVFYYLCIIKEIFFNLLQIRRNISFRGLRRYLHANRVSFFLIAIYIHIVRRMYYSSFIKQYTWKSRIRLILLIMRTSFLRYVLPWRQISFWRATVIINLFSVIPLIRNYIVVRLWRRFVVNYYTLYRFFSLHFLLPFIALVLVIIHVFFLHLTFSSNISQNWEALNFFPAYNIKDRVFFIRRRVAWFFISFLLPNSLRDVENYILANSIVTPIHIIPEWYFLFAYAILRCIPNKTIRVLRLALSVCVPLLIAYSNFLIRINVVIWLYFIFLTFARRIVVEWPYILFAQIFSASYFLYFII